MPNVNGRVVHSARLKPAALQTECLHERHRVCTANHVPAEFYCCLGPGSKGPGESLHTIGRTCNDIPKNHRDAARVAGGPGERRVALLSGCSGRVALAATFG